MNLETPKAEAKRHPKQRLLEAAIELFAEKGYASTSVREIVTLAGVTKPVLYYYYESKVGIFRAIMDEVMQRYQEIMFEVLKTPGSCVEQLIELYRKLSQAMIELPNVVKLFHGVILGQPRGEPECNLGEFPMKIMEVVKKIYAQGLARGEVAEHDPDTVALLFLSALTLTMHKDHSFLKSLNPDVPEQTLRLALSCLKR
ncbi:MAG: TetR/AcrR family transcriptional regulator [Deltaproteobacteria bacterium]|nr:TetR/AcrR family transcriptional regulator [Deltaproteobacteria bacterium]